MFYNKIACNFLLNNVYLLFGKALVMDDFLKQQTQFCKSCLLGGKQATITEQADLGAKKEVFHFCKKSFFPYYQNIKPNLATEVNEQMGFPLVLSLSCPWLYCYRFCPYPLECILPKCPSNKYSFLSSSLGKLNIKVDDSKT